MAQDHIVKSYDGELAALRGQLSRMGGLVETQISHALQAISRRDSDLASQVVRDDHEVDDADVDIDGRVVRLLALRQPMATDLRDIVAALKISSDLERMGDYAANVAKRALALNQMPPVPSVRSIPIMGRLVLAMLKDILDALGQRDAEKAVAVWRQDEEVDALYTSLFRELLTYMMEDPRNITPCTHLLFIAKNIERIGDHATNIAEVLHFAILGTAIGADRPKSDASSYTVMDADLPEA